MDSFFTKKFYTCLIIFASFIADAQTNFTATVSPLQAGKDEYITLKLTVANGANVQQIAPPSLNDFTVVSGPNQETEMNSVNGVTKQYLSLSYVLLPKKSGNLILGAGTAVIDGKTYKSMPLSVTVTNKKSSGRHQNNPGNSLQFPLAGFDPFDQPQADAQFDDYILRKGENVPEKVSKNMQLRLETNKTSCFVGEPIMAAYKLYTRLRSESSLSKNPSFNGFSVVDMMQNDPGAYTRESLNGRMYNVYLIRKVQLYPLQAGPLELETASLDNKIEFLLHSGGKGNAYADPRSMVSENVTVSSKPITVQVKALPEAGKPAGFKGAVGNFKIDVSLDKNNFSTDETGKLLITISGKGNMQLLTPPQVKWPTGFEAFEIKLSDNTDNSTVPISGSRTFEIPFAVQNAGEYHTPSIEFSFFDPATASYKTVSAPGINFSVSKGMSATKNLIVSKEKRDSVSWINSIGTHRNLILIFLGGLIITGLILWMRKDKKDEFLNEKITDEEKPVTEEIPAAIISQNNPLAKTEDCLLKKECVEFYAVLNTELKHFLAQRFLISEEMINNKKLVTVMDKEGIDNDAGLQMQQLLQDIEWQLYTPFGDNEKLHETYARAQTIIQLLCMQHA